MKIKKTIQKLVNKFMFKRLRHSQINHINKLNATLKQKGNYRKYPLYETSPKIVKYDFFRKSDLKWLNFFYSVNGKPDPDYISVPIYYYIETCLNNRMLTYALKEKNFYNKFMQDISTPSTLLRRINGVYYDALFRKFDVKDINNLLAGFEKVILKPSVESGGGGSILVFEKTNGLLLSGKTELNNGYLEDYSKDFIIQEFVKQHKYFSQFNEKSNNTIRVFTYRSIIDDSVHILHRLLRIGAKGSYLDHVDLGGIVLAIDDNNRVSSQAIGLHGNKYSSVNGVDFSSLDKVPAMEEIKSLAKKIAEDVYYGRLLALDFTVNNEGKPLLLEINCWRNGISQYQMHNGGLFNEFTTEILDYCEKQTPRFVLTF